jgi:Tfp pilus assembly protein PilP
MQLFKAAIVFILFCCIGSCSQNSNVDDLKLYVANMKKKEQMIEEKNIMAELKKPVSAVYSAKSTRVPFGETKALVNKSISTNPLLSVPLSMLRFTGTVIQEKSIHAFILAPDNKIYSVVVGDKLGDREDEVIHIYPNKIELIESIKGTEKGKIITLELNKGRQ